MFPKKGISTLPPQFEKPCEKVPSGVYLARHPEIAHFIFCVYAVDQHFLESPTVIEAAVHQVVNEVDRPHLAHKGGVETERIDAVKNGLRGLRHLLDLDGVDHDENHIGGG